MDIVSQHRSFGGVQAVYSHPSNTCGCEMRFAAYLPPQAADRDVPVLWYLSGGAEGFDAAVARAGFQEHAARRGLAVIFPDVAPRGDSVARCGTVADDLGAGAGFYVNATRDPWRPNYRMYDYILHELRGLVLDHLPLEDRHGITGHAAGGHGALTLALRNSEMFESVTALAPVANPTSSEWGRRQLSTLLGSDETTWSVHDATLLLDELGWKGDILVDQGGDDAFLDLLRPQALAATMARRRQPGQVRIQKGYDHSFYFVNTFAGDHVQWHAERLN
ncbi:S-formylglutathione hydrolase [Roseivivax marinus]|uniref:S-formylglutathione hydrolase n=1 Tax=Roseivivax marinus TaxID=1379903 RepID=UPI0008C7F3F6|nr:S-formylglutathione hydrolase [Roseivivax marinus]SEL22575.1 S-formylglutathione hydrolase [Roseivivax marinus]